MAQTLYFRLLLLALGSLCECIQRQYYYINTSMNWTDAQRYCRETYTDLATVNDMNELMKTVNNNVNFWIGLKNTGVYKLKWSPGDPVNNQTSNIAGQLNDSWEWSDKSDSTFRNWKSGEPNDNSPSYCTEVTINEGQWNDLGCSNTLTFVCHKDKLILIKENLSWPEALIYCRKNHVDLISVDSEEIEKRLKAVVQHASTAEVWLGLRHSCTVGIWFWVNGEMVCYEKWSEGNETAAENCETVTRSGAVQSVGHHRWISLPETERRNFICIQRI